jgi:hypothetical protein
MRRFALVLLLLFAACQPVPRPFSDAASRPTPALRPPDSAGIVVLPLAGAPDAAEAIAKALREADVPASTVGGNRGSFRLESSVATKGASLILAWTLRNAAGDSIGSGTAGAASVAALARSAAGPIARLVSGDAPVPAAAAVPVLVTVKTVSGAPGDGGTSLARAMAAALGGAGIEVGQGKARFVLSCLVAVAPPEAGKQMVAVHWVLALPEGRELGQVNQQNAVPAGSLDGAWGDLAYDVAGAAAPGIVQLVERARTTE